MPDYCRNRVPGGTYFFTVNLANRRSGLLVREVETLRAAIRAVRLAAPFHIEDQPIRHGRTPVKMAESASLFRPTPAKRVEFLPQRSNFSRVCVVQHAFNAMPSKGSIRNVANLCMLGLIIGECGCGARPKL